jgi:hypothetical protein
MALIVTRRAGMIALAIYLIVVGLAGLVPIPLTVTAVLALLAGILILIGR